MYGWEEFEHGARGISDDGRISYVWPSDYDGFFWVAVIWSGAVDTTKRPVIKAAIHVALDVCNFNWRRAKWVATEPPLPSDRNIYLTTPGKKQYRNDQTVYFIQSIYGGPIKIGVAVDVVSRLKQIQNMSPVPLKLLATEAGGKERESRLHEQFSQYRLYGEWFEPTKELLSHIAAQGQFRKNGAQPHDR